MINPQFNSQYDEITYIKDPKSQILDLKPEPGPKVADLEMAWKRVCLRRMGRGELESDDLMLEA